VTALPWLRLTYLNTQKTPRTTMTSWLLDEDAWPQSLAVERECELKSSDEEKSVVRYSRCHLMNDEVRKRLQQGMRPSRLAMSWDGRVAFTLTDSLQLRKLVMLATAERPDSDKDADAFDADVALATGEIKRMLPALVAGLGGELLPGEMPQDGDAKN
jgi:recombination associated protein RdgC